MKRLIVTIVSVTIILSCFTGCSSDKTAKTWQEFESIVQQKGFVINDDTLSAGDGAVVLDKISIAMKDDVYQIEFYDYKFDREGEAKSLFSFIQESLDEKYSTKLNVKKITIGNYNYYAFENGDVFELVIRVGDTLLYCGTSKEHKDAVYEIVELMEY